MELNSVVTHESRCPEPHYKLFAAFFFSKEAITFLPFSSYGSQRWPRTLRRVNKTRNTVLFEHEFSQDARNARNARIQLPIFGFHTLIAIVSQLHVPVAYRPTDLLTVTRTDK